MDQDDLTDLQHRLLTLAGMIMEDRSIPLIHLSDPAAAVACLAKSAADLAAIASCCDVIGHIQTSSGE